MRKSILRIGAASCIAATALLALPVVTNAEEPAPIVAGECESLVDQNGEPLEIDAGALLNAEDSVDVGLAGGGDGRSLLSIPVDAITSPLAGVPVVGDTVKATCATGKGALNSLTAPVQGALGALLGSPADEPDQPDPEVPEPEVPGPELPDPDLPEPERPEVPEPEPVPNVPGDGDTGPAFDGTGDFTDLPTVPEAPDAGLDTLPPLDESPATHPQLPGLPPVQAPELAPQAQTPPQTWTQEAGSAEAVPAKDAPERLPQLLAVLALAAVVVALARSWTRRKTT